MKKIAIVGLLIVCASKTALAYDYVDEMADRQVADINAQEQADVMHEVREVILGKPSKSFSMTKLSKMKYDKKKPCMTELEIATNSTMVTLDGKGI